MTDHRMRDAPGAPAPPAPPNPSRAAPPKALRALRPRWPRFVDPYVAALAATVALAALLPATGPAETATRTASQAAIVLLFFLYGVRLSTKETLAGMRRVRLHTLILLSTFVLFPLLGLAVLRLAPDALTAQLGAGILFLCIVPSTVQSSVALTSTARGDVAAAICAGTYSSVIGLAVTPLLAAWLIGSQASLSADGALRIAAQLLAPFLAGQVLRPWLEAFVRRNKRFLGPVDRASILLVVYVAFSTGVNQGVWSSVTPGRLLGLVVVLALLLAVALVCTQAAARWAGLDRPSRIAVVLCGSQKSLANGLPMASVLFGAQAAPAVLPLMLYHQMQLTVCAMLAARWSVSAPEEQSARTAASPSSVVAGG
ncbi:bile acid:sodium symporter family protein [Streptomyces sp. NPDC059783]|uniref:bile acid:sodium symporter family protein n=1 Tax=Streptomyces sp. NPDC059783 TaxID=3346944 RepID=UPI00364715F1